MLNNMHECDAERRFDCVVLDEGDRFMRFSSSHLTVIMEIYWQLLIPRKHANEQLVSTTGQHAYIISHLLDKCCHMCDFNT